MGSCPVLKRVYISNVFFINSTKKYKSFSLHSSYYIPFSIALVTRRNAVLNPISQNLGCTECLNTRSLLLYFCIIATFPFILVPLLKIITGNNLNKVINSQNHFRLIKSITKHPFNKNEHRQTDIRWNTNGRK